MKKNLSLIAKRRLGKTKKDRSDRMTVLAKIRQSKLTKKQKAEHARKMLEARYKNKKVNGINN